MLSLMLKAKDRIELFWVLGHTCRCRLKHGDAVEAAQRWLENGVDRSVVLQLLLCDGPLLGEHVDLRLHLLQQIRLLQIDASLSAQLSSSLSQNVIFRRVRIPFAASVLLRAPACDETCLAFDFLFVVAPAPRTPLRPRSDLRLLRKVRVHCVLVQLLEQVFLQVGRQQRVLHHLALQVPDFQSFSLLQGRQFNCTLRFAALVEDVAVLRPALSFRQLFRHQKDFAASFVFKKLRLGHMAPSGAASTSRAALLFVLVVVLNSLRDLVVNYRERLVLRFQAFASSRQQCRALDHLHQSASLLLGLRRQLQLQQPL